VDTGGPGDRDGRLTDASRQDAAWLDTIAHLTLQVGRILLLNGSET
jgi:hypothetical protein